jgi:lipid-A-disaccharide synthase
VSQKNIVVITGEASGDAHAGRMITELKLLRPEIKVKGIGGDNMRKAGAEIMVDFSELAVMGLIEVIKRYRHIKNIFNQLLIELNTNKPDLIVLVDYPGFNLKLAKRAKKLGIPVLYYISPKVWAWRAGRVKTIKRYVDKIVVLFPFEVPIYENENIPVICAGHPLVDAVKNSLSNKQAKIKVGLKLNRRVIGLFPGSRRSEIENLLPVMLDAAERIQQRNKNVDIVLPLAPGIDETFLNSILAKSIVPVKIVSDKFYQLTAACDVIVAASGTATLEIALLGVPHFIAYRVSPISYQVLSRLVKIPYVGLCNIVTGKAVVLELLQNDVTAQRLDEELSALLSGQDSKVKAGQIRKQILAALGPSGGAKNAAHEVISMLDIQQ